MSNLWFDKLSNHCHSPLKRLAGDLVQVHGVADQYVTETYLKPLKTEKP